MDIYHKRAVALRGPRATPRLPSRSQLPKQHRLSVGKDRNSVPKSHTERRVYFCRLQRTGTRRRSPGPGERCRGRAGHRAWQAGNWVGGALKIFSYKINVQKLRKCTSFMTSILSKTTRVHRSVKRFRRHLPVLAENRNWSMRRTGLLHALTSEAPPLKKFLQPARRMDLALLFEAAEAGGARLAISLLVIPNHMGRHRK